MTRPTIHAFGPLRPWVVPGGTLALAVTASASRPVDARVTVTLLDVGRVVRRVTSGLRLGRGPRRCEVALELPSRPRHGYGLRVRVQTADAAATSSSAVEALDGWWQSPRLAAVTEYTDPLAAAAAITALVELNVTVLQHYDWMWRHYRYMPPDGARTFTDALGRLVSHDALRAGIEAGHAAGLASLAYGSVYGAEPEHVEAHPDDRVFDESGEPLSLGGVFHINDLRPGSPWRERILDEYAAAVERYGFDGIHMDTYGPPHEAWAADGAHLDFAALYPGLIAEAARRIRAVRPGARVVLNCVDGWPLDAVAAAPTACLYLELWSSAGTFADVVRAIDRARAVAHGRQVIIAAYAAPLGRLAGGPPTRTRKPLRASALEASLLLGAAITAAGAYHHVLAEGERLLVEGYYPAAVALHPGEMRDLRALWRFSARYVHLLSDPRLRRRRVAGLRLVDAAGRSIPTSTRPRAGRVWLAAREAPDGILVLHLLDLRAQLDDRWDVARQRTPRAAGWRLRWSGVGAPRAATPWRARGDAAPLRSTTVAPDMWELPPFRRWLMVLAPPPTHGSSQGTRPRSSEGT